MKVLCPRAHEGVLYELVELCPICQRPLSAHEGYGARERVLVVAPVPILAADTCAGVLAEPGELRLLRVAHA